MGKPKKHDRSFIGILENFGHDLIDRGYARAWFSWIQWNVVTGLILVAALHSDSFILYTTGAASMGALYLMGIAGIEKLINDLLPFFEEKKWERIILASVISVVGFLIVFGVITVLLPATMTIP